MFKFWISKIWISKFWIFKFRIFKFRIFKFRIFKFWIFKFPIFIFLIFNSWIFKFRIFKFEFQFRNFKFRIFKFRIFKFHFPIDFKFQYLILIRFKFLLKSKVLRVCRGSSRCICVNCWNYINLCHLLLDSLLQEITALASIRVRNLKDFSLIFVKVLPWWCNPLENLVNIKFVCGNHFVRRSAKRPTKKGELTKITFRIT